MSYMNLCYSFSLNIFFVYILHCWYKQRKYFLILMLLLEWYGKWLPSKTKPQKSFFSVSRQGFQSLSPRLNLPNCTDTLQCFIPFLLIGWLSNFAHVGLWKTNENKIQLHEIKTRRKFLICVNWIRGFEFHFSVPPPSLSLSVPLFKFSKCHKWCNNAP